MSYLFSIIIFLFGLAIGSFLNVVILRLGSGQVYRSRSCCPKCGQVLAWYDLVPVLSFLFLRGRCRYCQKPISVQYPLVELATGILFLIIFNFSALGGPAFGGQFSILNLANFCYLLYVTCSLLVIFVYDLRHYIIPDKIIFPAIGAAFLWQGFLSLKIGHWDLIGHWSLVIGHFSLYFLSALGAAAFFAAIIAVTKGKGMGWGDVKFALLMGLILGWPKILLALFLAFFGGAMVGLGLIIAGKKKWQSQIPFGPFLALATLISMFVGDKMINQYFSFIGF